MKDKIKALLKIRKQEKLSAGFQRWEKEREEFTVRLKKGHSPKDGELINFMEGLTPGGMDRNGRQVSFVEKGRSLAGEDGRIGERGPRISK